MSGKRSLYKDSDFHFKVTFIKVTVGNKNLYFTLNTVTKVLYSLLYKVKINDLVSHENLWSSHPVYVVSLYEIIVTTVVDVVIQIDSLFLNPFLVTLHNT